MNIILYGNGAFGKAIREYCTTRIVVNKDLNNFGDFTGSEVTWAELQKVPTADELAWDTIAVYAGKGTHFEDMLRYCEENHIPLIQASADVTKPENVKVPFIYAPNLSPMIVAVLRGLNPFMATLNLVLQETARTDLEESHQQSKGEKTSGTAKHMAATAGIDENKIRRIRDPEIQRLRGVRQLDRHGYHWLTIEDLGVTVEVNMKVDGLNAYVLGLMFFTSKVIGQREQLQRRMYDVTEFI